MNDNLDVSNQQRLLVSGRNSYGLHLTAIQGGFYNVESIILKRVVMQAENLRKYRDVRDAKEFIDRFVPMDDGTAMETHVL